MKIFIAKIDVIVYLFIFKNSKSDFTPLMSLLLKRIECSYYIHHRISSDNIKPGPELQESRISHSIRLHEKMFGPCSVLLTPILRTRPARGYK